MKGIVAVYWEDAVVDHEEKHPALGEEFSDVPVVVSYGRLLENNEDFVRVAAEELNPSKSYRCTTTIPKRMVRRIEELR